MSRAGRQSHAAHPQTNLILQYDDWQVKKTFLELLRPKKKIHKHKKQTIASENDVMVCFLVSFSKEACLCQLLSYNVGNSVGNLLQTLLLRSFSHNAD